jgi:phosphatidylinositol dimannoside acyltransferase
VSRRPGARLTAASYAVAWRTVRLMPEWMPRRVFRLLADASYRRNGRWVRRLADNLGRVLGPDATEAEVEAVTRAAVRSYLRYWMEVFRLPEMSRDYVVDNMAMADQERLQAAYASDRGTILALPHMGNWDAAGAWCVHLGMPFTTVAERLEPAWLFDRFVAFRRGLGMEVLPLTGGSTGPYPLLRARLQAGGMLCLLADRDLTATGVTVSFFGAPARMPAGPAALALDTGAALVPVTLWYPEDGSTGWRGRIHEEVPAPTSGTRAEKVAAMTQTLADVFAQSIGQHPADWHMVQRLWVADLDPTHDALRSGRPDPHGAVA